MFIKLKAFITADPLETTPTYVNMDLVSMYFTDDDGGETVLLDARGQRLTTVSDMPNEITDLLDYTQDLPDDIADVLNRIPF